MWSRMGPRDAPMVYLEALKVPCESVDHEIHVRLCERAVDPSLTVHPGRWDKAGDRRKGSKGIITADVVWDGVGDGDIFETAGGDLVIVICVTPRPEALCGGIGKDRCVLKVRGIYSHVRTDIQKSLT